MSIEIEELKKEIKDCIQQQRGMITEMANLQSELIDKISIFLHQIGKDDGYWTEELKEEIEELESEITDWVVDLKEELLAKVK